MSCTSEGLPGNHVMPPLDSTGISRSKQKNKRIPAKRPVDCIPTGATQPGAEGSMLMAANEGGCHRIMLKSRGFHISNAALRARSSKPGRKQYYIQRGRNDVAFMDDDSVRNGGRCFICLHGCTTRPPRLVVTPRWIGKPANPVYIGRQTDMARGGLSTPTLGFARIRTM